MHLSQPCAQLSLHSQAHPRPIFTVILSKNTSEHAPVPDPDLHILAHGSVILSDGRPEHAPLMISNHLNEPVRISQKGSVHYDVVHPHQSNEPASPYAWDSPLERRRILVLTFGATDDVNAAGIRREVHIDGRAQQIELRLPTTSKTTHARAVLVHVDPVDCQRYLVRLQPVETPTSLFLALSRPWQVSLVSLMK